MSMLRGNTSNLAKDVVGDTTYTLGYLVVLLLGCRLCTGGDARDSKVIHGVVGGEVTFRCISDPKEPLNCVYFNKIISLKPEFINGYHQTMKPNIEKQFYNRTHVNAGQRAMTMLDVQPTDEGVYQCQIEYNNKRRTEEYMNLTVTANYSKPVSSVVCREHDKSHHGYGNQGSNSDCIATCSCHGGYPRHEVEWNSNLSLDQTWAVVLPGNWSQDRETKLFNITSTLVFNCTTDLQYLSCKCGGATSQKLSVCTDDSSLKTVIVVAVCFIMILGIIGLYITVVSLPKKQRGTVDGHSWTAISGASVQNEDYSVFLHTYC
ncbi:uncharacterized protein [Osmerus mordax]|uniref:uncharacterized protein isoform X1 n=1 Tax=Osmerus mordax TaxID=8014 RepID=UPI0035109FE8